MRSKSSRNTEHDADEDDDVCPRNQYVEPCCSEIAVDRVSFGTATQRPQIEGQIAGKMCSARHVCALIRRAKTTVHGRQLLRGQPHNACLENVQEDTRDFHK